MSRLLTLVAALTATAALTAGALAPDSADAQKRRGAPKSLTALLLPFSSSGTERGMLQASARRGGQTQIIAVLIGLAADEPTEEWSLNFTTIKCRALERNPDALERRSLASFDFNRDGDTAYIEQDNVFKARAIRRVRSVVLVSGREVQACGNAIKLQNVLVSS